MGAARRFLDNASPVAKTLMAIALTSGLIVINKMFYAPYKTRKRHLQAEEWASYIIEQEEKEKNQ